MMFPSNLEVDEFKLILSLSSGWPREVEVLVYHKNCPEVLLGVSQTPKLTIKQDEGFVHELQVYVSNKRHEVYLGDEAQREFRKLWERAIEVALAKARENLAKLRSG